ncbi:FtsX-like permease family protein [Actinoplanes sp. DH11]|uniref:FtsX-like permease family protein n=1 Tax=Actinoplanes sp. DH11 TaxID=2857011 RepID=UPI001E59608C|nr:FtsX-like permease family protein [Actinoplanes sp. DH11]
MFLLVIGAVRARTAQVLTILLLAALAAAVAVAGPWYGYAAAGQAAEADLDAARAVERVVSVRTGVDTQGQPQEAVSRFTGDVRAKLPPEFGEPVVGVSVTLSARTPDAPATAMSVASRDGFCANVRLDGPCPSAAGEVAITHEAAGRLGVRVGDRFSLISSVTNRPLVAQVVSLYALAGVSGTYWAGEIFRTRTQIDPAFTVLDTFVERPLWNATMVYDTELPPDLIRGDGGYDLTSVLAATDTRLIAGGFRLQSTTGPLLETVARDRATILRGVRSAGVQTLILTWFAIGLAGWYTLRDRRADTALLKLRGVSRFRMLRLAWGQHLVPLLIGAAIGVPAGFLLARLLAGGVPGAADRSSALDQSVVAVVAVLLGSLAVLAAVEAAMLGRPVSALLQRALPGRGDWRSALADLLLLAIAGAALYQARSGGAGDGLAEAAPGLVALALGLLLARLLRRVAGQAGAAALRAGRLRLGLAGLQFSRSPGMDRVFALVVVAVALFVTAGGAWRADQIAREERSAAELGATRVLTVEAANRTVLLHAVRTADPGGTQAMAVVRNRNDDDLEILEVDTSRLAAVARWRPEYGPIATLPQAMADGARPSSPVVTGDRLTVRARRDGPAPAHLTLRLQHEATGAPVTVAFGALRAGEQSVDAPLPGCAAAPGCRIVRWEVTSPPDRLTRSRPAAKGTVVTVRELTQPGSGAAVLDRGILGDVARWRSGSAGANLDIATADGALRMSPDDNPTELKLAGVAAYAADSPMPLPIVLAGAAPDPWQYDDRMLKSYGQAAPVRIAGVVASLPSVGRDGVLTDLDAVRRLAAEADAGGEFQVWLAPGARPGLVDGLTAAGLAVSGDETVTGRTEWLGYQGPATVARFALLNGLAALLLAAAVLMVAATVDNRSLDVQLHALRAQGLPVRTAVSTGYAGTTVLVLTGLAAGALAADLAARLVGGALPPFADGWRVLPPPDPLTPWALAVAATVALAVLGLAALLAVLPLVRRLRSTRAEDLR